MRKSSKIRTCRVDQVRVNVSDLAEVHMKAPNTQQEVDAITTRMMSLDDSYNGWAGVVSAEMLCLRIILMKWPKFRGSSKLVISHDSAGPDTIMADYWALMLSDDVSAAKRSFDKLKIGGQFTSKPWVPRPGVTVLDRDDKLEVTVTGGVATFTAPSENNVFYALDFPDYE